MRAARLLIGILILVGSALALGAGPYDEPLSLSNVRHTRLLPHRSSEDDCRAHDAAACRSLAEKAEQRGDKKSALEFFDLACRMGHADSCISAGDFATSIGGIEKGLPYLKLACGPEEGAGCRARGEKELAEGHYPEATRLMQVSCALGYNPGCTRLAFLQLLQGKVEVAKQLYRIACKKGDESACTAWQGLTGETGESTPPYLPQAQALVAKCRGGDAHLCEALGDTLGRPGALSVVGSQDARKELYRLACDQRNSNGCRKLASLAR
jgi:TPR repeat protein